jgi:hypothetical protein
MREVRKLCADGHQTSIVTTNKILTIEQIASCMFARWAQENFFRYMRQDYGLDRIVQYSIDEIDGDVKVVNREYSNLCYRIKKEKEKLNRRKAKMFELDQKNPLQEDEKTEKENGKWIKQRLELVEEIGKLEEEIEKQIEKRKNIPYKIPISQMPESSRYNRLNHESKILQNVIKMICYIAETSLAGLLSPHYKRANQEIRTLIKSIINTPIDMVVDYEKQELRITLYPLSNQRSNVAVSKICDTVNDTKTIYPGTNLKLIFKFATS